MTAAWRPVDPSDRAWSHHTSRWAFGGVRLASAERIRAALGELAEDPCIGVRFDWERGRVRSVEVADRNAWVDEVLHVGWTPVAEEPLGDLPFRLVLGPDWFHLEKAHGWGDGWSSFTFLAELFATSSGRPSPRTWTRMGSAHRDLMTACGVARRPVAAVRAVAHRHEHRGGDVEPRSLRAEALRPSSVHHGSSINFPAQVRALRDEFHPGASTFATFVVGLRLALAAVLPAPRPGVEVAFDNRADVPGADREFGNWSSSVYLRPSDDCSPSALSEAIRDARRRRLPFLSIAAGRVRARSGAVLGRDVNAPTGAPRLTVTTLRARGPLGRIPHDPDAINTQVMAAPNGIEAISVHLLELGGRWHVSLNFYPDVWDAAAVRSALTSFLSEPDRFLRRSDSEVGT